MKRADLTVGAEYLASNHNDWDTSQWGRVEKVTILDAGFWDFNPYARLSGTNTYTLADGTTVETSWAIRRADDGRTGRCVLVRPQSGVVCVKELREIRAPWEEGAAKVAEAKRLRNKVEARRRLEREEACARIAVVADEIERWTGERPDLSAGFHGVQGLSLDLMERLLKTMGSN